MKRKIAAVFLVFAISALIVPVYALAENDPRDSVPAPGGTDIFLVYYRNYNGSDFYQNDKTVDNNADFNFNLGIARWAHFHSLGQWTLSADILQAFGDMDFESNAMNIDDSTSGLGDTTLACHLNTPFLGQTENNKYGMSAGVYLTAPTGEYHSEKAVNLGSNRWLYKLEFTPVIWQVGKAVLEVTGEVGFYSDNDEFTAAELTQEKDPLYGLQTHLSYDITDAFMVGISHYLYKGGETEVNGIDQNDADDSQALRFTGAFKLTPQIQLLLQYHTEVERENGVKQNFIGTRLAYFW